VVPTNINLHTLLEYFAHFDLKIYTLDLLQGGQGIFSICAFVLGGYTQTLAKGGMA
jgi:hypothetical protein